MKKWGFKRIEHSGAPRKYSAFGNLILIAKNKLILIIIIYIFQVSDDLDVKMVDLTGGSLAKTFIKEGNLKHVVFKLREIVFWNLQNCLTPLVQKRKIFEEKNLKNRDEWAHVNLRAMKPAGSTYYQFSVIITWKVFIITEVSNEEASLPDQQ